MLNDTWDVITRGYPFFGSALVFALIVFQTWTVTPLRRLLRDSLSFSLVFFIAPWACYVLLMGIGFTFHRSPPGWLFNSARIWIGITVPFALWGLIPLAWGSIQTYRRYGSWPKNLSRKDGLP